MQGVRMTSKELICSIDRNFYKIVDTPRKMVSFSRELIGLICKENDVDVARLKFVYFQPFTTGDYNYYRGIIKINRYLYQNFEYFKEKENFYYIFQFVGSLVHEARHHIQFTSANLENFHPIVKNTAKIARNGGVSLVYNDEYNVVPLEIDARHYSYVRLEENPFLKKFLISQEYIDTENCNVELVYDYKRLLKNKKDIYKPTIEGIKKALSSIKTVKGEERHSSIYYSIAPSFRNCEKSSLSAQENEEIKNQSLEFFSKTWGDVIDFTYNKRKLNYQVLDEKQ